MMLFDTLSQKHIDLGSTTNQIKILVCGPTLYETYHMGHARVLCFYDMMARYFNHIGFHTIIVAIITDIDPKISAKAMRMGKSTYSLSNSYMDSLLFDIALLEVGKYFLLARVSNYVKSATDIIKKLLSKKLAYSASGNVYLDVVKIGGYGEMSAMSYDRLREVRIDIAPNKRNPEDILLWNSINFSSQQFFDPNFGHGIPWWHVQDVSVAMSLFEGKYDIHGGGVELIYPHHETILGNLRSLTDNCRPVGWWTHVGTVTIEGRKMSNSLSNTLKIRDLSKEFLPNVIKLYFLSKHYREELPFSINQLKKFIAIDNLIAEHILSYTASNSLLYSNKLFTKFQTYLDNDFDTPGALSILLEGVSNNIDRYVLVKMTNILGLRY